MASSFERRSPWLLLCGLAAACAVPPAPQGLRSDVRFSGIDPRFAGTPFDYRCGDCEIRGGLDGCASIGKTSHIVRVAGVTQRLVEEKCDPSSHDFSARCDGVVLLDLENPEVVGPGSGSGPPTPVSAEVNFVRVTGDEQPPRFPAGPDRYLFIVPDVRQGAVASYRVLANCPRNNPSVVSPSATATAVADSRISDFHPEFAGQTFDFRCGECQFGGAFECRDLGNATMVIRGDGAAQTDLAFDCHDIPLVHDMQRRCSASVAMRFEAVQALYSIDQRAPPRSVDMTFDYVTVNSRAPRFFDPGKTYTLFLHANPDRKRRLFSDHVPLAICPRDAINYEAGTEPMVPPWPGRAARP